MNNNDKEISLRINLFYKELFDKYKNLSQESIEDLRLFIDTIFIELRSTIYRNEKYRNQLYHYLYPDISLVGLSNLFSKDGYIQYSFLMKISNKIDFELANNKKLEKIK